MPVSPETLSSARTSVVPDSASKAAASKATVKRPRIRKTPSKTPRTVAPAADAVTVTQGNVTTGGTAPAELASMIATAAYFIAAQRNFAPGKELDDWLEAERHVLGRLEPGIGLAIHHTLA